jgi:hypothetical protein
MRIIAFIAFLVVLLGGLGAGYYMFPEYRDLVFNYINTGKLQTLEIRYSAENIMETHKKFLLKDDQHSYLQPDLHFHPYLLMEVKYTNAQNRTGEGIILWSLVDGEMVINTSSWDKTHGFTDCIRARADKEDFKIINALAIHGNMVDREALSRYLNVENDTLDTMLDQCRRKCLVVQTGNNYRLHLQNPRLQVTPETRLDQWLVTKPSKKAKKIDKKYKSYQIENTARSAFGHDFAIRKTTEIFLPVYSIIVQNPDGSRMTTYWNALNGKRLSQSFHID